MKLTDRKLYTDKEVYVMLGLSSATWYRMKRDGMTPKPLNIPGRTHYYTIEAIDEWRLGSRQAV